MSTLFGGAPAPTQQAPPASAAFPIASQPNNRPSSGGGFIRSTHVNPVNTKATAPDTQADIAKAKFHSVNTQVHDPRKSATPYVDAQDSIVTVHVGDPRVAFNVHRGVLLRSSEFLKTQAKPEWSKGEAVVELPHHQSTTFDLYTKWLYSDCIISRSPFFGFFAHSTEAKDDAEWALLAHAFVLGEALMDNKFKNTIMDALRAKALKEGGSTIWPVGSSVVHIIYDGTPQSSQARKFIVDIYHNHGDQTALDSKDGFPADFLLDLARTSLSRRPKTLMAFPGPQYTVRCLYHDHSEEGSTCYPAGGLFAGLLKP